MPSHPQINAAQLARLVGLAGGPAIIDVRNDEDFAADPRLIPGSIWRDFATVATWAPDFAGKQAVVSCQRGAKLSEGVAAWLRNEGIVAENLEGGFEAWVASSFPLVRTAKLPKRDPKGRTVWVTRARPKIDRIACPWLIRRFIDTDAVILFVQASEVNGVAERFSATPFDIEDVFFSHRGERCTFDTMLDEFGLESEPLRRLATIVRAADTARLDIVPEAAGLLAVSLGLSRNFRDDLEQLDAAMGIYDAFYRWCRDASEETHNWPTPKRGG